MNFNASMIQQAQKLQRDLKKAKSDLALQDFTVNKNGIVTVVMSGDRTIKSIDIDEDALDKENKEMIEEAIVLAIKDLNAQVDKAIGDINYKFTGSRESLM